MRFFGFLKSRPFLSFTLSAVLATALIFFFINSRSQQLPAARPKRGPIVEAVYGIGTVTSTRIFRGRIAQANGIQKIFVREGDLVQRGQRLLLLQDGITLTAPFPGTVTSLPFFAGETVVSGATIVTLQDLQDLYVLATLEQQGALRVQPGQTVRLNFESIRNQTFDGQVRSVFPQDTQFLVHITVQNLPKQILPGMTADVAIEIARRDNALLIPLRAISSGKIITRRAGKEKKIDVAVGTTDGAWAEVISGDLKENDEILIPSTSLGEKEMGR